jgi:putative transposase
MPLRGRSQFTDAAVFFVTTSTAGHIKHFATPGNREQLRETIFAYARQHEIRLFGYCLMPNHFHLLLHAPGGGPQLSRFMQAVKRVSAQQLSQSKLWQHRFDDLMIVSEKQFRVKLNYIHENPVRASLCNDAVDWAHSSASAWACRDQQAGLVYDFDSLYTEVGSR